MYRPRQREQAGGPNFTGSDAYKNALGMRDGTPNVAFLYLDSPAFFERYTAR